MEQVTSARANPKEGETVSSAEFLDGYQELIDARKAYILTMRVTSVFLKVAQVVALGELDTQAR